MSEDMSHTSTPAPDASAPVLASAEPAGAEPLWQRLAQLLEERKKNRFERGKILHELNELYALPGHGTFCKKIETMGVAIATAYRWMNEYREQVGIKPTPFVLDGNDISEDDHLNGDRGGLRNNEESGEENGVEWESYKRPGISFHIWLSLRQAKKLNSSVKKLVGYFKANGWKNDEGKPIDNKHDAVFEAVEQVANSPEVADWAAKQESEA